MKTEKILSIVFIAGILFKLMHWPGGAVLLVLSLMTLAILYFPAAFYFFCDKVTKNQNLPLSVISGFFLSIIPIGILFKVQYWPGGQAYMLVGAVTAPVILAVTYFLKSKAPEELSVYYKNMIKRTAILTVLAALFCFTSTSTLIKIQCWDDPEMARLKTQYFTNPENEEYERQYDEYMFKKDPDYLNKTDSVSQE